MRLIQYAPQRANCDFVLLWHDRGVHCLINSTDELYVTSLLADFNETGCFESPFNFAKR